MNRKDFFKRLFGAGLLGLTAPKLLAEEKTKDPVNLKTERPVPSFPPKTQEFGFSAIELWNAPFYDHENKPIAAFDGRLREINIDAKDDIGRGRILGDIT